MKKKYLLLIAAALIVCMMLTMCASADFARSKEYTEGMFADVPATEWYAPSVKDAYEFGIMNGNSATTFSPNGTLTVAEGITIASRIHQTLNNTTIPAASGEWYQMYVDYAIANGLMTADQFDSYDINIKRFEIAELLAGVCGELPTVNAVSELPDVASGVDYADDVLKLYNGGVLTGNDSYGTFAPNSYLLRSEISAMAVRIADSAKRVQKTFDKVDARAFTDSYYIIENVYGTGRNGLANGWNYDNRFDLFNNTGADKNQIFDTSDEKFYGLYRDFDPEYEGVIRLELVSSINSTDNGVYVALQTIDGEKILNITPAGGVWTVTGVTSSVSTVAVDAEKSEKYAFVVDLDLDNNTAHVVINNVDCGTVSIKEAAVSRLALGSNKVGMGSATLNHTRMSKNYAIDENFLVTDAAIGQKPSGWDVTGDFALGKISSVLGQDIYSATADSKAGTVSAASKNFTPITGKVVFETYVLFPKKVDGASVAVLSGGNEVAKFETKNGKITLGGIELHDYTENVWQWLYIEADTASGKAIVKVNGKEKATIDFSAKIIDGAKIAFAPATDAVMWFDDVEAYTLIDHADYPSYPQVAESVDYNVGLNVCYLWRDQQSGEGWDSVSPFSEFDSYLGFYDEGLRETADWETKWMAEHGIDFMHVCWYAPYGNLTAPIKKMRVSHSALHDGYMNSKYSDLVDFCIMWENNGQDVTSFEQFKEYIWKYWKEYYFSDPRYARLDNKAVLTVWNNSKMQTAFGGVEGTNAAIEFMDAELKEMGYDGIIVLFSTQGSTPKSTYTNYSNLGADGTYGYHWTRLGYDPNHQINCNRTNAANSAEVSHNIPTISVGFNDVGRNETRDPIITKEDHLLVCEDAKNLLSTYNTGTWKDNTVMISTWNEYSEGTYVLPTESNGFDYLENIRQVFTNSTSDHAALDTRLTQTQIDRVGHMYPPNHAPLRWFQFEKSDNDAENITSEDLVALRSYDMAANGTAAWKASHGITGYDDKNGVIKGTGATEDYGIVTSDKFESFTAADAPIIHIRLKTSIAANFEIFYKTSADNTWNQTKSKASAITKAGEFVDYYVNMASTGKWTDEILAVRIDPLTKPGDFEISLIEFMNYSTELADLLPGVEVNGAKLNFTFDPVVLADGDYEVVGEARKLGFYSSLRLYYDWDRFTGDGVLTLKTFDEKTLVFTVGSDKVTVDGKKQPLGYTFRLRDGLPVFHMKKLCGLLGYKYEMQGNTIVVRAANDEEYKILTTRISNQWEFDMAGETEGWKGQNSSVKTEADGMLTLTASGADIAILQTVNFKSTDYTHIVMGIKYEEIMAASTPQLFFTTSTSTSYTADKCINGKYDLEGKKIGDIVEVKFNLSDNTKFSGNITGIRIDPVNAKVDCKIDYIRCIKDESASDGSTELKEVEGLAWEFNDEEDVAEWKPQNAAFEAADGYLKGTPTNSDSAIVKDISFDSSEAQVVVMGVKYDPAFCNVNSAVELFFTTDALTALSADKCVSLKYNIPEFTNAGDTIEVVFDLSLNSKFYGKVTKIRIDVHGATMPFEVDYVRIYSKEGYVPKEAPEMVINKATLPTEAVIPDAESIPEGVKVTTSDTAEILTVEDPKDASVKVFKVNCVKAGEQYTYLNVGMNFVAGKKYNITYKLYPLENMNGEKFQNTIIGGNFMFGTDGVNVSNHTFDASSNKSSGTEWLSVSQTYDVPEDYNPSTKDCFQIWGKFSGGAGVSYLVKDISITLAE